jgi:hypothetical protein
VSGGRKCRWSLRPYSDINAWLVHACDEPRAFIVSQEIASILLFLREKNFREMPSRKRDCIFGI